ncbi:MAG TPA: DNA methyltransferase [Rectinema sp.]|nr:DNA methyltransferase [Rectinema sp.]HRR37462.1 DNA methyltransferase [Rectinema sp.]
MSLNTKLINLLKTAPCFVDDEGELVLAAVQDHAWKLDHDLVKLLLSDIEIKDKFFEEIDGYWIFNINTFIDYISQKNFLDNSYTRFRNKIGLTIGGKYLRERGEVALAWPYKDCVLEGGQTKEEEKRKEIFFNEVLAQDEINRLLDPKVLTNFTRYTAKGTEKVTDFKRDENGVIRENLIIKGNNLLALHTLKTQFREKVKLIYIDPPYNTGNDSFGYNDNFNHSTWLTFMKNRLEVAKELLTKDGSIYIQLDYNEVHYCKVLMDEIFGRENFQREIVWDISVLSGYKTLTNNWVRGHETILFYSKTPDFYFNKLKTSHDEKYLARFNKMDENGERYFDGRGERRYLRDVIEKGKAIGDVWSDIMSFQQLPTSKEKVNFDTQKTEALLERIINSSTQKGDLVLDFFSGSGTTSVVAHKLKRHWIVVEQLEGQIDILFNRIVNVIKGDQSGISKSVNWKGGGDFIYCELMKYNEAFMDRIQAAKSSEELLEIWKAMAENSFLNWYINPKMPEEAVKDFEAIGKEPNGLEKQKKLLAELLDKNQLYVNLSEIDDTQFKVGEKERELNRKFFGEQV